VLLHIRNITYSKKNQSLSSRALFRTDILECTNLLLSHCRHDCDNKILTSIIEILDLRRKLIVGGKPKIIFGGTIVHKQTNKAILRYVNQLKISAGNLWNITVVGRWDNIFQLLAIKDIYRHEVALCMPMFTSLRCGNLDNLARAALDDEVAVLADSAGLLREGLGGPGVGLVLEGVLAVRHIDALMGMQRGKEEP